ncbi:MAG: four-carbon acid sugar kinase family protein [Anaerolineales bacterium]|nr:four-carbon acid sugar kinase family protein [Anaerolineales bacterium]
MQSIAVIADDLTGGLDTGVQFWRTGMQTLMVVSPGGNLPPNLHPPVVVFNTDSRVLPSDEAYQRVSKTASALQGRRIYKKIDSTMRGNIGRELDALLDHTSAEMVILTPASPVHGRTVRAGRLYVHGVPLRKSAFAGDPHCPPTDDLVALLQDQSAHRVHHVDLDAIRADAGLCKAQFLAGAGIYLVDAEEEGDLARVAAVASKLHASCIPCGSAGLAAAIPAAYGYDSSLDSHAFPIERYGAVLVVAGSRHPATETQIRAAETIPGCTRLDMNLFDTETLEGAAPNAQAVLDRGEIPLLTAAATDFQPAREAEVAAEMGNLVAHIFAAVRVEALVLTGGETAFHACRALEIEQLSLLGELLPGIPFSRVLGGTRDGLTVITKAGGFGEPDAIRQILERIHTNDGKS